MFCTCRATVCSLITSLEAICLLVSPAAMSERTSTFHAVNPPAGEAGAEEPSNCMRSDLAPSRSNTQRAASNSISADCSSPSARQASPSRTRTRAASYGASTSCHARDDRRNPATAALGRPSASWTLASARSASARTKTESMVAAIWLSSDAAAFAAWRSPLTSITSTFVPIRLVGPF
jgi:hypothetical protein